MNESQTPSPLLSPVQQKLVSAALALLAINLIAAIFVGLFLILRQVVMYFSDVLWPLAIAGILAMLLRPLVIGAQQQLRLSRVLAIFILYALVAAAAIGIAWSVLPVAVRQAVALLEQIPDLFTALQTAVAQRFPELHDRINAWVLSQEGKDIWQLIGNWVEGLLEWSVPAAGVVGEKLAMVFTIAAGIGIIPVYLFFFLMTDKDPMRAVEQQLSFIPTSKREDIIYLMSEFARIMVSFFRGQILIGLIMGVLMAIGFSFAGLKFGLLLGIVIGLLNIIPYLGSILGLITVLPLAYLQPGGGWTLLLIVAGIFSAVQLFESYLLTPRIMGRSTGLHPLLIIISIFFWGQALGGLLGMILAIPLTAFFVIFWRLIRKKYLPSAVHQTSRQDTA